MVDNNEMTQIINQCGQECGMSAAELAPIIAGLNKDGYRTKAGLQDMAKDNEWGDYNFPKALKKKVEAVL